MKKELYRLTDSFLVEATNEKGEHRSLERLNADRHLFVESVMKLIQSQIASAVEAREREIASAVREIKILINPRDKMSKYIRHGYSNALKDILSIINPSKE